MRSIREILDGLKYSNNFQEARLELIGAFNERDAEVRAETIEECAAIVEDAAERLGRRACHGGSCMASPHMADRIRSLTEKSKP